MTPAKRECELPKQHSWFSMLPTADNTQRIFLNKKSDRVITPTVTAVIIGGSRGIGYELCKQLTRKGSGFDKVVCVCRKSNQALEDLAYETLSLGSTFLIFDGIDVTDSKAINTTLVNEVSDLKSNIDLLVYNSGVFPDADKARVGGDAPDASHGDVINKMMQVNAVGAMRVCQALDSFLGDGSKVVLMSSRLGSLEFVSKSNYQGMYGYKMSKAAMNMFGVTYAAEVKDRGIIVLMISPGSVETDMTRDLLGVKSGVGKTVSPEDAVTAMLKTFAITTLEQTGSFVDRDNDKIEW